MIVYLDENNMCHIENKDGYKKAEHSYFDTIPTVAVEFYKYIPERDFIQCTNSLVVDAITRQYRIDKEKPPVIPFENAED